MTTLSRRYPAIQGELEYEAEQEDEAFLGGLANIAGSLLGEGELEFEFEAEAEVEGEDEAEGFANPIRRIYPDAEMMAHLANQAAQTESESEAEAFIGALIPIAARLIPRAARLISGNAPTLVRGTTRIARRLRADPRTRRLVTGLPVVLQRTAQSLADQAAAGRPIDTDAVVRTLGTMTGRVLGGGNAHRAVRAVGVFDRRYHRRRRRPQRRRSRYPQRGYAGYDNGYVDGYGSGNGTSPAYWPTYHEGRRPYRSSYRSAARRRAAYPRRYRGVRPR
jgi:hypothetical protein